MGAPPVGPLVVLGVLQVAARLVLGVLQELQRQFAPGAERGKGLPDAAIPTPRGG